MNNSKEDKSDFFRHRRISNRKTDRLTLYDHVIEKYIHEVREFNKQEIQWIELLSENHTNFVIFEPPLFSITEDLIVQEFLLSYFGIIVKPFTVNSASKSKHIDSLIKKSKNSSFSDQFSIIPYLFIRKKYSRIQKILNFFDLTHDKKTEVWKVWLFLFQNKKISLNSCESCIFSQLSKVYSTFYSKSWNSYGNSIKLLKSFNMKELEPIIHADLIFNNNNQSEDHFAITLLVTALPSKYGLLSFFRLLKHYFEYNLYKEAQMLCVYVQNKYVGEFFEIAEAFIMKIKGKLKNIVSPSISANNYLCHYYFCRACIKYNLRVSYENVKFSFEILKNFLENFELFSYFFEVLVVFM